MRTRIRGSTQKPICISASPQSPCRSDSAWKYKSCHFHHHPGPHFLHPFDHHCVHLLLILAGSNHWSSISGTNGQTTRTPQFKADHLMIATMIIVIIDNHCKTTMMINFIVIAKLQSLNTLRQKHFSSLILTVMNVGFEGFEDHHPYK